MKFTGTITMIFLFFSVSVSYTRDTMPVNTDDTTPIQKKTKVAPMYTPLSLPFDMIFGMLNNNDFSQGEEVFYTDTRVILTDTDIIKRQDIETVLEEMVRFYKLKDIINFMSYISYDFYNNYSPYEEDIRKIFDDYDNIAINTNIDRGIRGGRFYAVRLHWTRRVTETKTGNIVRKTGDSEYIFIKEDIQIKLIAVSGDNLFDFH